MDFGSFINPIETAQLISVFSYLNIISDFLYIDNALNETDLYKPIPVVNALYKYLVGPNEKIDYTIKKTKLEILMKQLIAGTDLYGAGEGENLDEKFVKTLFDHIINSLVFDKYGNIYGFFAEIVRTSNDTSFGQIRQNCIRRLRNEKFKNEYGPDSHLDELSITKIDQQFILPLFPQPKNKNISIISVDYIYAQAGSMFLRSIETRPDIDSISVEEFKQQRDNKSKHFEEYIHLAHIIEQLVTSGNAKMSALRIFAIPALLHYVSKEKAKLVNQNIINIIQGMTHWQNAFNLLFSHLNDVFKKTDKIGNNESRHQFLFALLNFKNRTALARGTLKSKCPGLNKKYIEREVAKYLQESSNFSCVNQNRTQVLPSLNTLLKEQNDLIAQKYYKYEKESIKKLFDTNAVFSLPGIEVWKGLVRPYAYGTGIFDFSEIKLTQDSDDLLEFYDSKQESSYYYALVRRNFTVFLINEVDDPRLFRETLGLYKYEPFQHVYFPTKLKSSNESLDIIFSKIANYSSKNLLMKLNSEEHEARKTTWKELILSLVPFYTCLTAIKEKDKDLALFSCSLDALFFIPGALELSMGLRELTTVTSETILEAGFSSIRTATSRMSIRAALAQGSKILAEGGIKFSEIITPKLFQKIGIGILRLVDPGFELAFSFGTKMLDSLKKLIYAGKIKYPRLFKLTLKTLDNTRSRKIHSFIDKRYNRDVFVQSISKKLNSGYGYKFVYLPSGKIAEFRKVVEYQNQVPVIFSHVNENYEKIYKIVNPETGTIGTEHLHIKHQIDSDLSRPGFSKIDIKSVLDKKLCNSGRVKRSPFTCSRSVLLIERKKYENIAVDFAVENGKLTEEQVRSELKKYVFLEGEKTELDFVSEWIGDKDLKPPVWSENMKVEKRELFYDLRYKDHFENAVTIEERTDFYWLLYEQLNIHESTTFEDFKAISKYTSLGFMEIGGSTDSAKIMREALYRLAIRQCDDDITEYASTLYRGETRPTRLINNLVFPEGKEFVLERFLSTSTDETVASSFTRNNQLYYSRVFYNIKFPDRYLRVKVNQILPSYEEEIILLPGTKFTVDKVIIEDELYTVFLTYVHTSKLDDIKNVMSELKQLEDVGPLPFPNDDNFQEFSY